MSNLHALDATALATLLHKGEVSARDVTEVSLARIDAMDRDLNAFVTADATAARAQARALDEHRAAGGVCGPLHGLPVAIKIKATKVPAFKPGKGMKENIAKTSKKK